MKLVLVEPTLHDNGAIRVSLDRAARWQRAGASVSVFVVEQVQGAGVVDVPAGLCVRHATAVPRRFRLTFLLGGMRLWWLARQADVVVAGREVHAGLLLAARVAPLAGRPLAVTVQSRPDFALLEHVQEGQRGSTRRALVGADLAVCVASGLVPDLVGLGMPEDRVRVVTNGVEVDHVRAEAAEETTVVLPAGPLVVGSGRLHRQKGFDVLLRAHASALRGGAPLHSVVILGEGPERVALAALADELGVTDSVVFAGFVPNPHAVVGRADVFVLPSRWEGYPLALVEALCCGIPSIAADCVSGPDEVLAAGAYGALFPVEDHEALAAALVAHLREPAELRVKARAAAVASSARFDPDVAALSHLGLLEDLMLERRPPVRGRLRKAVLSRWSASSRGESD